MRTDRILAYLSLKSFSISIYPALKSLPRPMRSMHSKLVPILSGALFVWNVINDRTLW